MAITPLQLANVLAACLVTAMWLLLLFKFITAYRLDAYRQKMFALRDELFDYARDGHISFDDPAYALLRNQMNALIRNGHQITLFRLIISAIKNRLDSKILNNPDWYDRFERAVGQVSDSELRGMLHSYHHRAMGNTVWYLVTGSPPLIMLILLYGLFQLTKTGLMNGKDALKTARDMVMVGPIGPRQIEEQAHCAL